MTEEEILDQMDREKILDQSDQEEHIIGEPKIHIKVEAMPTPHEPQTFQEESMNEAKPEKKKNKFWCCCWLKGNVILVYLILFQAFQLELT